jgi:hypothetical protein
MTNLCQRVLISSVLLSAIACSAKAGSTFSDTAMPQGSMPCLIYCPSSDSASTKILDIVRTDKQKRLRLSLAKDKGVYAFTNNGADSLNIFFEDVENKAASFINRPQELANLVYKQNPHIFYITNNKKTASPNIPWWAAALGGLLIGGTIGTFAGKKSNKNNSTDSLNMPLKEDLIKTLKEKTQGMQFDAAEPKPKEINAFVQKLVNEYDNLVVEREEMLIEMSAFEKQIENFKTETEKLNASNKALQDQLSTQQAELKLSKEFITKLEEKYLNNFYNKFGNAMPLPPLNDADKKLFTETIYSIAFHVLSYGKKVKPANDLANLDALVKDVTQTYKQQISLSSNIAQEQYNALIVHMAEELKRNGVSELKNVNFEGYGFTA